MKVPSTARPPARKAGFTLIELSLVLVIIGALTGGVLVGQDMVKSAELRTTVSQREKYDSAVNAFRMKYGFLPGDLPADKATQFGFTTRTGAPGQGDGNAILEGRNATPAVSGTICAGELKLFWADLSSNNLIDSDLAADETPAALSTDDIPNTFPQAHVGPANFFTVLSSTGGLNYYEITGITGCTAGTGAYTLTTGLSPQEAYNLDAKIDDGVPNKGVVRGLSSTTALNTACADGGAGVQTDTCCENNDTATLNYNTFTETTANTPLCQLRLRMN